MRAVLTLLLVLVLSVCAGCPSIIEVPATPTGAAPPESAPRVKPKEIQADGPVVHGGSGMVFPESIGPFRRVQIVQYDADGLDMSFRYDITLGPGPLVPALMITVYVYPRPVGVPVSGPSDWPGWREAVLRSHFEEVKDQIRAYRRGAVLLSEGETRLFLGGEERTGLHAAFQCPHPEAPVTVFSEVYLFIYGDWFIKYRISHVEGYRERFAPEVSLLMRSLKWP